MVRSHRLADHVRFETLAAHAAWFDLLQKEGLWEQWLRDEDGEWVNKVRGNAHEEHSFANRFPHARYIQLLEVAEPAMNNFQAV